MEMLKKSSEDRRMHYFKNYTRILLWVILFIGTGYLIKGAPADAPVFNSLNPGFEKNLDGWTTKGEGYKIDIAASGAAKGKKYLRFFSTKDPEPGFPAYASMSLPLKLFKPEPHKKRIRLSAQLKTKDFEGRCVLWIRADNEKEPAAFERMMRGPSGNAEWKEYTVEMDIPAGTRTVYTGVMVTGKGTAMADDFKVEVVPAKDNIPLIISGKVVDQNKKPVRGAIVSASAPYNESAFAVTASDGKGKFRLRVLPGTIRLTAAAKGRTAGSLKPRAFEKNTGDLVITLGKGGCTIKGKINAPGNTIPGETYVAAKPLVLIDSDLYYCRPNTDGSFQVTVPAGKSYKIEMESPSLTATAILIDKNLKPGTVHNCTLQAIKPADAPGEVVTWMKKNAVSLKTPEAGHGLSDMMGLKPFIGGARIVALGESTHGTREIFQMKHRFFEFLVEKMGFTVFTMESPWAESLALNDYVLTGKGEPEKAIVPLLTIWHTEEVLELIKWMRAYNADPSHTKKVKIYGVDVGSGRVSVKAVFDYLNKVNPAYAKKEAGKFKLLHERGVYGKFLRMKKKKRDILVNDVKKLVDHFAQEKNNYSAKTSKKEYELARHHAVTLRQFIDYINEPEDYKFLNIRTRTMAENAKWILENEGPDTRMVVWAHNFHISVAPYPGRPYVFMGMHLRKMLGNDFISLGFAFNRGSFQALDFTTPRPGYFILKRFSVGPYTGSYGKAMARTGLPFFYLDLRRFPSKGVVHDWFARPHVLKWINTIYDGEKEIKHLFHLPSLHDGVIFIEKTTRARPLPSSDSAPVPY